MPRHHPYNGPAAACLTRSCAQRCTWLTPSTAALQVTAALEENRLLVKLIAALQPHKHSFTLQPPGRGASRGSKNGTGPGTTPSSSGLTQPDTPGTSKQLRGAGRGSLSGEGHNPGGRPCCLRCWPRSAVIPEQHCAFREAMRVTDRAALLSEAQYKKLLGNGVFEMAKIDATAL